MTVIVNSNTVSLNQYISGVMIHWLLGNESYDVVSILWLLGIFISLPCINIITRSINHLLPDCKKMHVEVLIILISESLFRQKNNQDSATAFTDKYFKFAAIHTR